MPNTGWENVSEWYDGHLKEEGSLLKDVVYPSVLKLLDPKDDGRYLDIACGEGAFTRLVAGKSVHVSGFDAAPSLVASAKKLAPKHTAYAIGDARSFSKLYPAASFDGATCLLAIQNIDKLEAVFAEAAKVLKPGAPLIVAMNHPAFRIPGASSWGFIGNDTMYRHVDKYLSVLEAPITAHPGSDPTVKTVSYHRPISTYVNALAANGFTVSKMDELVSNRISTPGARAKAENLSRREIPMFLVIKATRT